MAVKIDADYSRGELLLINPADVIVDEKLNGRAFPHDQATIERRCASFESVGQLQPVVIRKVTGSNKVQLVAGYCRHAAAMLYNERHPDKPMKLKAVISSINEEEAFERNIIENTERQATSLVDDAVNQRRLREEFGWKDKAIAELYGVTTSFVSQLKKLLSLRKKVLGYIHKGVITFSSALQLIELTNEEQDEVLRKVKAEEVAAKREEITAKEEEAKEQEEAKTTNSKEDKDKDEEKPKKKAKKEEKKDKKPKIKTGEVSNAVREVTAATRKDSNGTVTGTTVVPRRLAEIKEFLGMTTGPAEHPKVRYLCESLLKFIAGEISEAKMSKRLDKLFISDEQETE